MSDKFTAVVEIGNLTQAQLLALEDLMAIWVQLGAVGASRWTAFMADGDGNFRPRITFNGKPPEVCPLAGGPDARWKGDEYRIDFDAIAWALHAEGAK